MRDYRDAKAMARNLRQALETRGVTVTHSESLELIARSFGFDNWNILAARIAAGDRPAAEGADFDLASIPMAKAALGRLTDGQLGEVWRDVVADRRSAMLKRAKPVANQP